MDLYETPMEPPEVLLPLLERERFGDWREIVAEARTRPPAPPATVAHTPPHPAPQPVEYVDDELSRARRRRVLMEMDEHRGIPAAMPARLGRAA